MSMEASGELVWEAPHDILATKELPQDLFRRWWSLLAEEDRMEFTTFYQGDEILARFVCVLDYLIIQKVQGEEHNLFALAYHIAAKPFPEYAISLDNPGIRPRAHRAWTHNAVEALMGRVRYRATKHRRIRLENLITRNAERMLEDAEKEVPLKNKDGTFLRDENGDIVMGPMEMKDRQYAMNVALKYLEITAKDQAMERIERTKLGVENARKSLNEREEEVDPKVLKSYAQLALKSGLLTKAEIDAIVEK